MSLAVVCFEDSDFNHPLNHITLPAMKLYAARIGAEFLVLSNDEAIDFEDRFDRSIILKPWMLIRFDCPDLFKIVPETMVGMFDETDCTPDAVKLVNGRRYNTDVTVVGRKSERGFEDVFALPHRFNRLPITVAMTGEWFPDSFIANCKDLPIDKVEELQKHWAKFETSGIPLMRKRINIDMPGALGDCVAMEPIVRYIKNVLETRAVVTVRTAFPEVFDHLIWFWEPDMFKVIPESEEFGLGYRIDLIAPRAGVSFNMMHPLDFGALNAFGGVIPKEHRRIHLRFDKDCSVGINVSDCILIHPGRTWQSRTFPAWWWQGVIDGLLSAGLKIIVIGKDFGAGTRGTVEGLDTSKCIDLRNKLNLKELIHVIFSARMLITNDSSPVHIAGASKTPTIMITSCKHAEFIWPQRPDSLNITMGRPISGGTPRVGLVASTKLDTCEPSELLDVLPDFGEVVGKARAYLGR